MALAATLFKVKIGERESNTTNLMVALAPKT